MSAFRRAVLCAVLSAACGIGSGATAEQTGRSYPDWLIASAVETNPNPRIVNWITPPAYAIAPRTIGIVYGPRYFVRQAYSGPAQRGRAYNVRRRAS